MSSLCVEARSNRGPVGDRIGEPIQRFLLAGCMRAQRLDESVHLGRAGEMQVVSDRELIDAGPDRSVLRRDLVRFSAIDLGECW